MEPVQTHLTANSRLGKASIPTVDGLKAQSTGSKVMLAHPNLSKWSFSGKLNLRDIGWKY